MIGASPARKKDVVRNTHKSRAFLVFLICFIYFLQLQNMNLTRIRGVYEGMCVIIVLRHGCACEGARDS